MPTGLGVEDKIADTKATFDNLINGVKDLETLKSKIYSLPQ